MDYPSEQLSKRLWDLESRIRQLERRAHGHVEPERCKLCGRELPDDE